MGAESSNPVYKDDYTSTIYEVIMVSIAGSIMLMSLVMITLRIAKRRWNICGEPYDQYMDEANVPKINVNRNKYDNISTINVSGPAHVAYIAEKEKPASEIPIGKLKLSRDALLYISLITCVNLSDDIDSEGNF